MKKTVLIIVLLSFGFSQKIIHTETYENGNIKSITYHKITGNNIELVKLTSWHENGQKKSEKTFKDGKEDGTWTEWSPGGKESSEFIYKDGNPWDGLFTSWYENGQKESEGIYKDGEWEGLWTGWYENGQKWEEGTFKDGGLIEYKEWDEDGNLIE